jgi:outer membrane lipoprotein-sorting protein
VIDRNYNEKVENRRIILRPGEKLDLFKLGQGPFPLPIGQPRQDVYAQFEVSTPKSDGGLTHVTLKPRAGTSLAEKFLQLDVWVDPNDHMPRRIVTLSQDGAIESRTELSEVKINPQLTDADFQLPAVQGWDVIQQKFE